MCFPGGDDPYVTVSGNHLVDIKFEEMIKDDLKKVDKWIRETEGVVAHGLLVGCIDAAVVGSSAGAQVLPGSASG